MLLRLKLDGRTFRVDVRSAAVGQGDYLAQHLRLSGVPTAPVALEGKIRTKEQILDDLVTRILLAGRKSYFLAGCLTEEGKIWSRAEADSNAARFGAITDPSEKAAMQSWLVEFVDSFFSEGK